MTFVVFAIRNPPLVLPVKLGAESAKLSGGVGGWEDVERPGRESGTEWGGLPATTLPIPVLFDGLAKRRSIEAEIALLYFMGRPPVGAKRGTPPPVVKLAGMVPHYGRSWVINGIDEGDAIWNGTARIRLWATVTMRLYQPLDVVQVGAVKGSTPATRSYTIKKGDTFARIAKNEMGARTSSAVAKGVAALKKLNKLRSDKDLKPGKKLKIPR
jgi:LysM repeat protein